MSARTQDPDTSQEASAAIQKSVPMLQRKILIMLLHYPMGLTTRELSLKTGIDFATVTPRMRPMADKDWVEMTPAKRQDPQGRGWGHVWVLTLKGRGTV